MYGEPMFIQGKIKMIKYWAKFLSKPETLYYIKHTLCLKLK